MTPCVVARLARMRLLWYFRNMFAPRNRFLAVAATLLGAAFAPRPTDASIPSAISRPQFAQVAAAAPTLPAAPTTPSHILLYVAPDGSCQVEFCRNDPVNSTDPTGLGVISWILRIGYSGERADAFDAEMHDRYWSGKMSRRAHCPCLCPALRRPRWLLARQSAIRRVAGAMRA
jgi:hypothetical protein